MPLSELRRGSPVSDPARNPSVYDKRTLIGSFRVTKSAQKRPTYRAKYATEKNIGKFKTESVALAAIDAATVTRGAR
jgi:hypothetical protein